MRIVTKEIIKQFKKELSKNEYEKLLTAAKEKLYYLRQTIAGTGVRVSELKSITCEAVSRGQAVINRKGKIRQIFLPKQLSKMLKQYIRKKNIQESAVFIARSGKPLDRLNIWRMLKELCETAGVSKEKVFPHNFRFIMQLLRQLERVVFFHTKNFQGGDAYCRRKSKRKRLRLPYRAVK